MDHDQNFKELLGEFFIEFVELFLPEIAAALGFRNPPPCSLRSQGPPETGGLRVVQEKIAPSPQFWGDRSRSFTTPPLPVSGGVASFASRGRFLRRRGRFLRRRQVPK